MADEDVVVSIRMPASVKAALQADAERSRRSTQAQIVWILEDYLNNRTEPVVRAFSRVLDGAAIIVVEAAPDGSGIRITSVEPQKE